MAVSPSPAGPPQIRDYWKRYRKSAVLITTLMQVVITLVIGLSLIVGGQSLDQFTFWITIIATLVATTILNNFIVDLLLQPLRDISMAVTSAAGEKPSGPLANPNIPRYQRSGFKPLLQFIYDHAAAASTNQSTPTEGQDTELTAALETITTGIIIMNAEGTVHYANKSAPVKQTTNGKVELDLLFTPEGTFSEWLAECQKSAVRSTKSWARVANRIVGDEERRIFNVTANYEKGSAAEVVLVTYDATNVYQPEDDELDFISFAAHELRGPITVIRGYLDVLEQELEQQLGVDQQELFKRLIVSANRLSGYVNNILNTSKYDRRHLKIQLSEQSLASIYDIIHDDMELRAGSQRRLLSVTIPPDLPTIAADRSSLSEVISNLIDNAIKYSNEGGAVAVTAEVEGEFVKVSVSDNGIGMPANVIGNLFHKFYRSHRSRETVAGSGIGLYICKAIVESHGGKMNVSSTEGAGSVFSFTVPTYASVAAKLQANDFTNAGLVSSGNGWIKNHSRYSG